jgi:GDSL-like lipase/acylhydrolase family protein
MLVLAGLLASLTTFATSGTASAAEYIPELQWPAVQVGNYSQSESSPQGETTLDCDRYNGASDLVTYGSVGNEVRRLASAQQIDGVANCIYNIAVDKTGDLYGSPDQGPNLLAYDGNALKWKYPLGCTYYMANPVVGADGNIYAINNSGRLLGLTPEVEPGTTQPKKVLDVPVSNARCDTQLLAIKDGLVALRNLKATFYSYNGVNLGSTPSDAIVQENVDQISATGRVFYDKYIESGGLRSATVSAYDYGRKQTMWTGTVSVNGAYVYSAAPRATPDGGTVVYLREKERDQFGTFTGYMAYTLVKVSAFGIVQWRKNLPRIDISQSEFAEAEVKVDVNGNVIVARSGQLKTNDPNNGYVEGISIAVFNSGGAVIYDKVMRGNLDKNTGTVTGYLLKPSTLQPAPGVLHFVAQPCTNSCASTTKLYPLKVTGLGLDYPRGAIYNRAPRPAASYIALGDSFSAGEGVEPFGAGTDTPLLNKCHRSDYAYARLIAGTSAKIPSLVSNGFRACSGAVTENITDAPQWNEGTQLDLPVWPDSTTQLVTLTIGGNDIGFVDIAKACINPASSCAINSTAYNTALNKINNELPSKLSASYKSVLKYAPNAKIYVLGYPQVIANKTVNDGPDLRCVYMQDGGTNWAEAQGVRSIVTKLNEKIVAAINAENSPRLRFVDVNGASSQFQGHEICGAGQSYFQNLDQAGTNEAYVFHPNAAGQQAYATLAANAINAG